MNKYAIWAVAIIISFFVGRGMYLPLSGALLAKGTSTGTPPTFQKVRFGGGTPRELLITINLETIKEEEMPATVELQKRMIVSTADGSQETALEKGSTVNVRKKNGSNLVISPGGPLVGIVRIADTDFVKHVIKYRARYYFGGRRQHASQGESHSKPGACPRARTCSRTRARARTRARTSEPERRADRGSDEGEREGRGDQGVQA